jgi:phospholipase C
MNAGRPVAAILGLLLSGLLIAACGTGYPDAGSGTPLGSGAARSVAGPARVDHVVIILEENKPAADVLGSAAAPFLNKLAAEYAVAANYSAVTHPSLPNYLALTSGTTAGITSDCSPDSCQARVPSIAGELEQAGRSWKMYAEGMPGPCVATNSGRYAVRHNPFMYYPEVTGDAAYCAAHDVPFTQLDEDLKAASTLPDYVFISPDLCHDMHNCPVATGDAWLSRQVPKILASPAFTQQNSLLVITWDEGRGRNNKVAAVFAGPAARKSYRSDASYGHYSLLHTIEKLWGLAPLTANDRSAPVMDELLR